MANIKKIQNKDGTYRYKITISTGFDKFTGMRTREIRTFHPDTSLTEKQQDKAAAEYARETENRIKNSNYVYGDKICFCEFVVKWVEYAKQNLEASTLSSYATYIDLRLMPRFGGFKLSEIKPVNLVEFYQYMLNDKKRSDGKIGYSGKTIKKCHSIMSTILSTVCKWEIIDANLCDKVFP